MNNIINLNPKICLLEENYLDAVKSNLLNKKSILITSKSFEKRGVVNKIQKILDKELVYIVNDVKPNPSIKYVDSLFKKIKDLDINTIITIGGGSSIDTGKAIALLYGNKQDNISMHNHLIDNIKFNYKNASLPIFAIPTTAGTGSEVTHFATIWDSTNKKKYSIASRDLYPQISVLDPMLTLSLPKEVTISSALDALSHAVESIWNKNATKDSLIFSKKSLSILIPALELINNFDSEKNLKLRLNLLKASTYSGLAIDSTRTALAHSISYPLTLHYDLPHGIACSFALSSVLKFNKLADDGRIKDTIFDLGYSSIEEFEEKLLTIFIKLDGIAIIKKYIGNLNDIMLLTSEMLTPERANNNLRAIELDDIRLIIDETIDKFKRFEK